LRSGITVGVPAPIRSAVDDKEDKKRIKSMLELAILLVDEII
jgi:hypothetical protein